LTLAVRRHAFPGQEIVDTTLKTIIRIFNEPFLIRKLLRIVIRELGIGSYAFRYAIGAVHRPNYAYLVYQAAQLAARLGEPRVSILEFGVAGGAGLLALEHHAEQIEKMFPVRIEIYGFDTGSGLPAPEDYRDLPYHWKANFFKMDVPELDKRLKRSTLVLGNVTDTISTFFDRYHPAPVGAVSQDLDYYSSTATALKLFDAENRHFLPRVICYFDDTIGGEVELYNDFTGARLAINEFNDLHHRAKLSPVYYLSAVPSAPAWHHQMWSLHYFDHPNYNTFVSQENQQLGLSAMGKPGIAEQSRLASPRPSD
jgi:hypothetical protein